MVWDVALAVISTAIVVAIEVSSLDAVPANRRPDVFSVLFSIAAIAPLALRRRAPLAVLIACFPGIFALIAGTYSVGAAPVGTIIGFYTAVAWDSRRNARRAVLVVIAGSALVLALRPIDLGIEGVIANTAALLGCWVIGTSTRDRREHAESQAAAAQLQLTLERQRADLAAVRERLRISRELHDVLGHAFSVMVVQAGVAQRLLNTDPGESLRAIEQIAVTGRTSLAELRDLVGVLRRDDDAEPECATPATLSDLAGLAERVRSAGLDVQLQLGHQSDPGRPASGGRGGIQLAIYRIVQESLTNCLKHAQASVAWVRIVESGGVLDIEVRDNGIGCPASVSGDRLGQGLAGMRERVAIYGGDVEAGPLAAGGYRVHARLPLSGTSGTSGTT